jgi:hypothetical protein
MTEQELFEKYYSKVDGSNPVYKWDGSKLMVPGSYSHPTEAHCLRNIGKFKVFSYRRWAGNGFGHDSTVYVVNTETKQIYRMGTSMFTFTQHLAFLKEVVSDVE